MPRIDTSKFANGRNKVRSCAYTYSKNTLAAVNSLFVFIGLILICVAAYGRKESILALPVFGGVIACGVFLILLSIAGLVGAIRHDQVILFFYMIVMSLLFILLLVFSVAALAVTQGQQHELIKQAWKSIDEKQKLKIESTFKCCALDIDDKKGRDSDGKLGYCYEKLREPLDKALSICGGIGLVVSFTLIFAVYCTVRLRNQKDPRLDVDAYM